MSRRPKDQWTKTNTEAYLRMYRQMVRIRAFEDNANQLYLSAKMPGLTHMYSGRKPSRSASARR
jgi:acetoin:2,6-dichlorophenolindophenol oxidoreductase subunit alpha